MKISFLTAALFLLAASLAWAGPQTSSAETAETHKAAANHSEKSDRTRHKDRSDRDAKREKDKAKDKMKKAPSREEHEYDPTQGIWG